MIERSEYVNLIVDRFCDSVYPDGKTAVSYEAEMDYLCLVNAPGQYENEDEMLAYAKSHPEAEMRDLVNFFFEITPPGLPPCASEWDDDEDE